FSGNVILNYQGSMGSLLLQNGRIIKTDFPILTNAAQTLYSSMDGAEENATENNVRTTMVGAGTVWKMTCQLSDTPGGTSTRKFTLRKGTGASANASTATTMLCTITNAIATCTPAAGSASAPIAFAAGDRFTLEQVSTLVTTLNATTGSCALYVSYDTVM